jgi:hypothetical protein
MLGLIKKFSLKRNKENLRDAMEDLLEEISWIILTAILNMT